MKKRILCLALVMVMIFTSLPMNAFAADVVASGTCGSNLTWTLDNEGTLTISGTGKMEDFSVPYGAGERDDPAPWSGNSSQIKRVNICQGVENIGNFAFSGCAELTSVTIPDSVTNIGKYAFCECSSLQSVKVPDRITSIGTCTFAGCTELTNVTIPDSVTSIGKYAFSDCSSLQSVTIPDSVTSIGDSAFYNCTQLTDINYNAKAVTNFSNVSNVFYNAGKDERGIKVTFGDSVEKIPAYLFYTSDSVNRPNISNVSIGSNVTSIGSFAFSGCTEMTNVTIADSVTSIDKYAFSDCSSLQSVTIPDSVTSIGDYAFYDCTGLKNVYYGGSEEQWNQIINSSNECLTNAAIHFNSTDEYEHIYTSVVTAPTCTEQGFTIYTCSCGASYVADYVDALGHNYESGKCTQCGVIEIINSGTCGAEGENLTWTLDSEGTLTISGTGEMDAYSFSTQPWYSARDRIKRAVVDNGVTSIGSYAFSYCRFLTSVTIPDSVTTIGSSAFSGCTGLTSVTIPDSVTTIGSSAFSGCTGLTSVTIPDSVTTIGSSAFSGCTGLTEINYNAKAVADLTSSSSVFYNAGTAGSGIKVTIGDGVEKIPAYLFRNCSGMTSVTIPDSVTSIGESAFANCTGLTSVTIPGSVTNIRSSAFSYCSSLTSVTIPDSVTGIGEGAFYDCSSLASVTIPDSVTSIGDDAFSYCSKLKDAAFGGTKEEWEATGYTFPSYVRMHYSCKSLDGHYVPVEVKEPNCQSTGYIIYNCNCGYEYTETLPKSHDYVFSKTVAPTCSEHGYDLLKCSKCGAEKKEYHDDELLQHSYVVSAVEPSCLEGGYKLHKCSVCGDSYKDELVQPLGHSETNAEAKAPTCTEAGHTAGTCCSRCGKIMSGMAEIAALGHKTELQNTKAASCTEPGYTGDEVCTVCGVTVNAGTVIPALGHNWDDGVVTTAPTATADGVKTYTCTVCKATKTEVIPATSLCDGGGTCPSRGLSDVKTHWGHSSIDYCVEHGLMNGVGDGKFNPDGTVTRAMLATVLYRQAGSPDVQNASAFPDVNPGEWYGKAIAWAADAGIVTGYPDGTFDPNKAVTRQELATMFYRYAKFAKFDVSAAGDLSVFPDRNQVLEYAMEAMVWANGAGLITGNVVNDVTCLDPKGNATRSQLATILMRFCENIAS